jgi:hypothetical protein
MLTGFVLNTSGSSTVTGYYGGTGVRCEKHIQADLIHPSIQVVNFPETVISYSFYGTSGHSINGSETPFVADSTSTNLTGNENNELASRKLVANRLSETNLLSGNRSFKFDILMTSSNDSLSPIVDAQRLNVTAVANRLNNPTQANTNVSGLDDQTLVTNTLIAFASTGSTITSSDNPTALLLASLPIGCCIGISGSSTGSNNATWEVTGYTTNGIVVKPSSGTTALVTQATGTSITITQKISYLAETAIRGSSSLSKFVTKRVNLDSPSTYLRIIFGAMVPNNSSLEVYYRIVPTGSTTDLSLQPYVLINPDVAISNSTSTFSEVNYTSENMTPYDGIQVKIVFKGTDSANVPVIKDLRIISCA